MRLEDGGRGAPGANRLRLDDPADHLAGLGSVRLGFHDFLRTCPAVREGKIHTHHRFDAPFFVNRHQVSSTAITGTLLDHAGSKEDERGIPAVNG